MNYYRPSVSKKRLRSLARNAVKHKKRTGLIIFASVLLVYLLFDNKGIIARVRLESRKDEIVARIEEAERQNAELKEQVKKLETDRKTIETIAREKYGMTRKGEKLYRVQKLKNEGKH